MSFHWQHSITVVQFSTSSMKHKTWPLWPRTSMKTAQRTAPSKFTPLVQLLSPLKPLVSISSRQPTASTASWVKSLPLTSPPATPPSRLIVAPLILRRAIPHHRIRPLAAPPLLLHQTQRLLGLALPIFSPPYWSLPWLSSIDLLYT